MAKKKQPEDHTLRNILTACAVGGAAAYFLPKLFEPETFDRRSSHSAIDNTLDLLNEIFREKEEERSTKKLVVGLLAGAGVVTATLMLFPNLKREIKNQLSEHFSALSEKAQEFTSELCEGNGNLGLLLQAANYFIDGVSPVLESSGPRNSSANKLKKVLEWMIIGLETLQKSHKRR
jgi:hypothetical protein